MNMLSINSWRQDTKIKFRLRWLIQHSSLNRSNHIHMIKFEYKVQLMRSRNFFKRRGSDSRHRVSIEAHACLSMQQIVSSTQPALYFSILGEAYLYLDTQMTLKIEDTSDWLLVRISRSFIICGGTIYLNLGWLILKSPSLCFKTHWTQPQRLQPHDEAANVEQEITNTRWMRPKIFPNWTRI